MFDASMYQCPPRLRGGLYDHVRCSEPFEQREMEERLPLAMEAIADAYQLVTGRKADLSKLPIDRQRLLAGLGEATKFHHNSAAIAGRSSTIYRANAGSREIGLRETVTTADIPTLTTQVLAFLADIYMTMVALDVFTTVQMTGPTAFINRQRYVRGDASTYYSAGSALNEGLDPSYSECPAECEPSNEIDIQITSDMISADCRRLSGSYCIPANYHYSSQYGGDLGRILIEGIGLALRRDISADLLALLVASAGGSRNWNRSPTAGTYHASANPAEWVQELWNTVKASSDDILNDVDGRVAANIVLGDVSAIGIFGSAVPIQFNDQQPQDVVHGSADEMTSFYGVTKTDRFAVYRAIEGLPPDTLVVMNRNDREPTAVYAPWVPITSLGVVTDPERARVAMGAITLYGSAVTRPKRVRLVNIGP